MYRRKEVAKQAFGEALRMRRAAGLDLLSPISVFDLAERLGVEVRFINVPSLEGMYVAGVQPNIILSSLRPPGRTAFNCAHELGHHNNGDGTTVDELLDGHRDQKEDVKEFTADCFAGALLMPKMAIQRAFTLRGWHTDGMSPDQIYAISQYFGVGYSTLVQHLHRGLGLLDKPRSTALLRVSPRQAQAMLLGFDVRDPVVPVDHCWTHHPIDVETGTLVFAPKLSPPKETAWNLWGAAKGGSLWRATRPGIGKIENRAGFSAFIRVSKRGFVGRSVFRHLPDDDAEEPRGH